MKKLFTLCACALTSIAALAALPSAPIYGAKSLGQEVTSVDQIDPNKHYLLYDACTADAARTCIRYINVSDGAAVVYGVHIEPSAATYPLTPNYLWNLEKDDSGNVAFKSAATGMYIPLSTSNGVASTSNTAGYWSLTYNETSSTFEIKNPSASIYFNGNASGGGYTLAYWSASHPYKLYEVVDTDDTYEWWNGAWVLSANKSNLIGTAGNDLITKGDFYFTLSFVPQDYLPTWTAAKTAFQNLSTYTSADYDQLHDVYVQVLELLNGKSVKFEHDANAGRFISWRGSDSQLKLGYATDRNIFTLRRSGDSFYLFSEYGNGYYKQNAQNNCATIVTDQASATPFYFKQGFKSTPNSIYLKQAATTSINGVATYAVSHANTAGGDKIVPWNEGTANSSWTLHLIDPIDAAKESLKGAADSNALFGNGVHKYCSNLYNIANNPPADATEAQLRGYAATLRSSSAISAANLNQPTRNRFYRFKGANTATIGTGCTAGQYMMAENGTTTANRIAMVASPLTEENQAKTILFLDANNRIVAYPSGYVLGKFLGGQTAANWRFMRADNSGASPGSTFGGYSTTNNYTIQASSGRYIYSANPNIDCGSSTPNDGYSWLIEEVTELPVTCDATTKLGSFFSPVQIDLSPGSTNATRFEAYAVETLNSGYAAMEKLTTIPANTPVILKQLTESNLLTIDYNLPAVDARPTNSLSGSYLAVAKPATPYLTLTTSEAASALTSNSTAEIPGFTAYHTAAAPLSTGYKLFSDAIVPGRLYTIANANEALGAIHHEQGAIANTANSNQTLTPSDPNHLWGIYIDSNNNSYLFNAGAKLFANAYDTTSGSRTWGLSPVATAVTFPENALANCSILSSDNPANNIGCNSSGNLFNFAAAQNATPELWQEITALADAQTDVVNSAKVYHLGDVTDINNVEFGQYPASTQTTYEEAIGAVPADATLDKQYYLINRARAAATASPRISVLNGHVYEITESGSDLRYHFPLTYHATSNVVTTALPEQEESNDLYKWIADVDASGNVTFYQNWIAGHWYATTGRRNLAWETEDQTLFTITPSTTATGDATLVAANANAVALAEANVHLTHTADNSAITTGISELTTDSAAPCYDLQGRRIARPARGLYIQNGRKLLR